MKLFLINHDYRYAVEQILLTLFPDEHPEYSQEEPAGDRAELSLFIASARYTAVCRLYLYGREFRGRASVASSQITDEISKSKYLQRIIKLSFYRAALNSGKTKPVWGALTGIRPGKLL